MDILLHVVHALSALAVIVLVLLQQGKGADAGASFGAGASQTVFGSAGSSNFMTRSTAIFAAIFMVTSLTLAWVARQDSRSSGLNLPVLNQVIQQQKTDKQPAAKTSTSSGPSISAQPGMPQAPSNGASKAQQSSGSTDVPTLGAPAAGNTATTTDVPTVPGKASGKGSK